MSLAMRGGISYARQHRLAHRAALAPRLNAHQCAMARGARML